jgi:hypothetical protein
MWLLYAGDPDVAVHTTAAAAHVHVWELDPVRVADLVTGDRPVVVGKDQPAACSGPGVTNAQLRDVVAKAIPRVAYQQVAQGRQELDAAAASLGCLSEPAEASLGAQLFYVRGVFAAADGAPDAAAASFARALAFDPQLAWDDDYPPDWRPTFDQAKAAATTASTTIAIGPGLDRQASLWIDGRMVPMADGRLVIGVGRHLVQVLEPSVTTLELDARVADRVAVVVPSVLGDAFVANAADPAGRPLLDALIAGKLAGDGYVWTGDRVLHPADDAVFEPMTTASPGRAHAASLLVGGGEALAGLGIVGLGAGYAIWAGGHPDDAVTTGQFDSATNRQAGGSALFGAGLTALGGGVALLAVGVPLGHGVAVVPGPRGVAALGRF